MKKLLSYAVAAGLLVGITAVSHAETLADLVTASGSSNGSSIVEGNYVFSNFSSAIDNIAGVTFSDITVKGEMFAGVYGIQFSGPLTISGANVKGDFNVNFTVTPTSGVIGNDLLRVTGSSTGVGSSATLDETVTDEVTKVGYPTLQVIAGVTPGNQDSYPLKGGKEPLHSAGLVVSKDLSLITGNSVSDNATVSVIDQYFPPSVVITPTPEPGVVAMFVGMGMGGIVALRRRRK